MKNLGKTLKHLFHPQRSNNHRPRILHPEALFFFSLIVGGLFSFQQIMTKLSLGSILGFASNITPSQVIDQTNSQRATAGLAPLTLSNELSQAALAKGQDMFTDQYWAHTAPDGTQPWYFIHQARYEYQVAGENLARDFSDTPSMMTAWMASPTHRANIMNSRYEEIGIAVIDGVLEGYETTLVVQMFGTRKNAPSQISRAAPSVTNSQRIEAETKEQPQALPLANVLDQTIETLPASTPQAVLASVLVPAGSIEQSPLFSPLQLTKAFFLAVIMLIVMVLVYDTAIIGHRQTMRLVGKNLAHIILLTAVAFLVIFFKAGVIG